MAGARVAGIRLPKGLHETGLVRVGRLQSRRLAAAAAIANRLLFEILVLGGQDGFEMANGTTCPIPAPPPTTTAAGGRHLAQILPIRGLVVARGVVRLGMLLGMILRVTGLGRRGCRRLCGHVRTRGRHVHAMDARICRLVDHVLGRGHDSRLGRGRRRLARRARAVRLSQRPCRRRQRPLGRAVGRQRRGGHDTEPILTRGDAWGDRRVRRRPVKAIAAHGRGCGYVRGRWHGDLWRNLDRRASGGMRWGCLAPHPDPRLTGRRALIAFGQAARVRHR